ncbi:MAG: hypothetical protein WCA32_00205 [Chromatiaceae bacterium]|jgi:hypothetical protein
MSGKLTQKGDPLMRRANDPGYRVGWRDKAKFAKGHFDNELTYSEAKRKAEELAANDPEKTYFPELILYEEQAG